MIEEGLTGPELSLLVLCDGTAAHPFAPAQDHKRVFDDDKGPSMPVEFRAVVCRSCHTAPLRGQKGMSIRANMTGKGVLLAALGFALLAVAPAASGARFGLADDAGKYADDGGAAFFADARALGASEIRVTVNWDPLRPDTIVEQAFLDRSLPVAKEQGVGVVFHVFPLQPTAMTTAPAAADELRVVPAAARAGRTRRCATTWSGTSRTNRASGGRSSYPGGKAGSRSRVRPSYWRSPTTRSRRSTPASA